MHSMHPTIDDSRINLARHEWGHAWLALEQQFAVDAIVLEPHQGSTTITYPLTPTSFAEAFEQSPHQAAHWLVGSLAIIRAGNYVEVHGGKIGWDPDARDLEHIEAWRTALLPVYGPTGWGWLYAESFRGLKAWFSYPEVRAVFREVAPTIASQRRLSRHALLALYHESGAATCPAPYFEAVLPSPRRQPAPVQVPAFSATLRHRTELQPVPTAIQDAHVDDDDQPLFSNTVPLQEDAHHRYYALAEQGAYSLYRFEAKASGGSTFVVGRQNGRDRRGKPQMSKWEFATEIAARRELGRLASR